MIICPKTQQHCPACEKPCNPPAINPLAVYVPEEREPFRGILPPFLESISEKVSVETDLQEEAKITVTLPL